MNITSNVSYTASPKYVQYQACCYSNDNLGIILGAIAILLGAVAFCMQERGNRKIKSLIKKTSEYTENHKKVEDAIQRDSLSGINAFMIEARRQLQQMVRRLDIQPNNEALADMLYEVGYQKTLLVNSEAIIRFANNMKFLQYELYKESEFIGRRLQHLSTPEDFVMKIPDYYQSWSKLAQETIQEITIFQDKIKDQIQN